MEIIKTCKISKCKVDSFLVKFPTLRLYVLLVNCNLCCFQNTPRQLFYDFPFFIGDYDETYIQKHQTFFANLQKSSPKLEAAVIQVTLNVEKISPDPWVGKIWVFPSIFHELEKKSRKLVSHIWELCGFSNSIKFQPKPIRWQYSSFFP